jgi:paraquat-inducible protein B
MADLMNDNNNKKWVEKEYASKGVGNTALGLGIGALGLELLKNGGLNLGNLFNNNQNNPEQTAFGLYKGYRDADDAIIAKHNQDSFSLYKFSRDGFDAMQKEICDLKTKLAVAEAVEPWKNKSIYDAIGLEAERRCCNDGKIVNYSNLMFYPVSVADVTTGTTSTQRGTFNPLCGCNNNCL